LKSALSPVTLKLIFFLFIKLYLNRFRGKPAITKFD